VTIDTDKCTQCGLCIESCPHRALQMSSGQGVIKCDYCRDRKSAGKPAACVAACPTGALETGDMTELKRRHPLADSGYLDGATGPSVLVCRKK